MKLLFCVIIFSLFTINTFSQNVSGKWYGKAFQGPGELCTECDFELDLDQSSTISGKSYHYQKDTASIRMRLFGSFDKDTIRLEEFQSKDQEIWIFSDSIFACLKKYMLKYQIVNNKEYLIGRGIGKG